MLWNISAGIAFTLIVTTVYIIIPMTINAITQASKFIIVR